LKAIFDLHRRGGKPKKTRKNPGHHAYEVTLAAPKWKGKDKMRKRGTTTNSKRENQPGEGRGKNYEKIRKGNATLQYALRRTLKRRKRHTTQLKTVQLGEREKVSLDKERERE